MMPLMPPQLTLWGSPLYSELCVGLCRALASPWIGGIRPAEHACRERTDRGAEKSGGTADATQPPGERPCPASHDGWRVFDSRQAEAGATGATSLAELCETVRELRSVAD